MKRVLAILLMAGLCAGCGEAIAVYGIHKSNQTMESVSQRQAQATETLAYSQYKTGVDRTNLEREKAGLKPLPVMGLDEWKVANR